MMEASELMIGDIVRVNKDVCFKKGTIVRVHAIDGDRNFPEKRRIGCVTCVPIDDPDGCSGGVWTAFLEPIPLTAEILEKNGFKYDDEGKDLRYRQSCGDIIGVDIRGDIAYIEDADFKYIHKLQHALKLCGIEKEITV